MRRVATFLLLVSAALTPVAGQERDASQQAYRDWRQTDPNLERDAISAGATLGARADKAAAEGAKYFIARKAYLESLEAQANRNTAVVDTVNVTPDATPSMQAFLDAQNTRLGSNIEVIARDSDRGIQQLRQALERERAAIAELKASLEASHKNQDTVMQTAGDTERARTQTVETYQKLAASLKQSAELTEESGKGWANYYRALSDAARGAEAVTSSAVRVPNEPATSPAPVAAVRGITPVPLARYVGEWTYPTIGAHYHGIQPESVDLVVREDNGQASGTLSARFKLPPGAAGDPAVRFQFTGSFQNSRTQTFAVTTSDGAQGTLELIPGPAFNLLEVNFSIAEKLGSVSRQANFLLIKK